MGIVLVPELDAKSPGRAMAEGRAAQAAPETGHDRTVEGVPCATAPVKVASMEALEPPGKRQPEGPLPGPGTPPGLPKGPAGEVGRLCLHRLFHPVRRVGYYRVRAGQPRNQLVETGTICLKHGLQPLLVGQEILLERLLPGVESLESIPVAKSLPGDEEGGSRLQFAADRN